MKKLGLAIGVFAWAFNFGGAEVAQACFVNVAPACQKDGSTNPPTLYPQLSFYNPTSLGGTPYTDIQCCWASMYGSGSSCPVPNLPPGADGDWYKSEGTFYEIQCDGHNQVPRSNQLNDKKACAAGSVIGIDNQTLGEEIPIPGAGFSLTYSSARQVGYFSRNQISIPLYNANVDGNAVGATIGITVGNQSANNNFPPVANTNTSFTYNGLTASGSLSEFGQSATISSTFNDAPVVSPQVPYGAMVKDYPVGGYHAVFVGLGGWQISIHHAYDNANNSLELGSGETVYTAAQTVGSQLQVLSSDGTEVYNFDLSGHHLNTLTALTGSTKYTFGYNSSGFLQTITDAFSNVTTISYTGTFPTQITTPYGQVIALGVNTNGLLNAVTLPAIGSYGMTYYDANAMLHTFTKPSSEVSTFAYDTLGRLTSDSSTAGPSTTLSRTDTDYGSWQIASTSNLGRHSSYLITQTQGNLPGPSFSRTEVEPSLAQTIVSSTPQSSTSLSRIYVDAITTNYTADPRFELAVYPNVFQYQGGTGTRETDTTKSVTLNNVSNPFSINTLTTSSSLVGVGTSNSVYTGSNLTTVTTSPVGRTKTQVINNNEKITSVQNASFTPKVTGYDSRGRLSTITQGARVSTYGYDSNGFLNSIKNPMNQTTSFINDSAGRPLTQKLPDNRVITYTYDSSGNVTSITPANNILHELDYNLMNFLSNYKAPSLGSGMLNTVYTYNNDRQITQIQRPEPAQTLVYHQDPTTAQLNSITSGSATFSFTYNSQMDQLYSATSPDNVTSTLTYNGALVSIDASSGQGKGTINLNYDNLLHLVSTQIGKGTTYSFLYDNDELLTKAGTETITRSPSTGLISATKIGNATEAYSYSPTFGETASYTAKYSTTALLSETYLRDKLGRITSNTVVRGTGASNVYTYNYDVSGRMTDVILNGTTISHYGFDSNSNVNQVVKASGTTVPTYDAEDRLVTYGTLSFTYNLNGERLTKTDSSTGQTTHYAFDNFGELKQVTLPSSTVISYLYDGRGRRVAKLSAGTVTERYVYLDQNRIAGVLNSSGATVIAYIWGSKPNVPEYMVKSGTTYKIVSDHEGTVRLVVGTTTGTVAQEITYDEFGNVMTDSAPGFQPLYFAGGLYDQDTKLVHFGARDYDPSVGRWISKDPILFNGGDTNLYGYVLNDPINAIDPTGHGTNVLINGIPGGGGDEPMNEIDIGADGGSTPGGSGGMGGGDVCGRSGSPISIERGTNSPTTISGHSVYRPRPGSDARSGRPTVCGAKHD